MRSVTPTRSVTSVVHSLIPWRFAFAGTSNVLFAGYPPMLGNIDLVLTH